MKVTVKKTEPNKPKDGITIRLELIMLILVGLKLQDQIDISWGTILLIMTVPMVLGRLLVWYIKHNINSGKWKVN